MAKNLKKKIYTCIYICIYVCMYVYIKLKPMIIFFFFFGYVSSLFLLRLFSSWSRLLSSCNMGFSLQRLLFLQSSGSWTWRLHWFWLPGFRAQAQYLWHMGLAARWHVGCSRIRDQTCISCISRWILYHWATWEAQ